MNASAMYHKLLHFNPNFSLTVLLTNKTENIVEVNTSISAKSQVFLNRYGLSVSIKLSHLMSGSENSIDVKHMVHFA